MSSAQAYGELPEGFVQDWQPSQFSGRLFMIYGPIIPRPLVTSTLAWLLLHDFRVHLIDGANALDGYGLARLIKQHTPNPRPLLKRLAISRAFTCYQLVERVATLGGPAPHRPGVASGFGVLQDRAPTRGDVLYLLGLLDTFYDESVPQGETVRLLHQVIHHLNALCQRGVAILVVTRLPPERVRDRAVMVELLYARADVVYRVEAHPIDPGGEVWDAHFLLLRS